jgi:hypothetical protein
VNEPLVLDLTDQKVADFGLAPLQLRHRLSEHPLFSEEALIRLLETVEPQDYQLNTMDASDHDSASRREGRIGDLTGREVLQVVASGRIWILLMRPQKLDPRYGELLRQLYDEFAHRVPGFRPYLLNMAILISSPNAQVYYHCDIPGQMLWQIRGTKRIYIYPNKEPFLDRAYLEQVALGEMHECGLPYERSFDRDAVVYDLQPGQMLHWPLNAPHRIENANCVNVSFATEHFTRELRRHYYVNCANGVLRKSGRAPLSQKTDGLTYWTKFGVAALHKISGSKRKRKRTPKIEFAIDPTAPNGVRPLTGYNLGPQAEPQEETSFAK